MRVSLDDFNDVPTLHTQEADGEVRFVSLDEFVSTPEPAAEPLLGSSEETILPLDGMLLMYGDGGAGKTTLSMDAMAHLASGTPWLGLEVQRPLKVTVIENEGPRAKFRQALERKTEAWNGSAPFRQNVTVLEEPWTQFSLRDDFHRNSLALHISQSETDLVVMGPLVTLGMVGGGTPDEVSAFEKLIGATRDLVSRAFAFWIVHHENKAGDVSGAWERVPDTLVHIQAQGNGYTRLRWQKARWSSSNHGTSLDLVWEEGRSFSIRTDEAIDHHAEILSAFVENDEWRTAKEVAALIARKETPVRNALSELVDRGDLQFMKGPPGKAPQAHGYRLQSAPDGRAHMGALLPSEGHEKRTAPLRPPYRETGGVGEVLDDPKTAPNGSGAVLAHNPLLDE